MFTHQSFWDNLIISYGQRCLLHYRSTDYDFLWWCDDIVNRWCPACNAVAGMFSHREKSFDLIFQSLVSASCYTIGLQVAPSFDGATTLTTDGGLRVTLWPECSHIAKAVQYHLPVSVQSFLLHVTTSFDGATTLTTDGALCVTLWPKCSHIATNSALLEFILFGYQTH